MRKHSPNQWWQHAVIYQIYPKSFAGTSQPHGDIAGIKSHLRHVADLGTDAVWISPFYVSPQRDGGYDVADYRDIDTMYGSRADVEDLIDYAHSIGLRIIFDLVPNHTSDQHPWFQSALAAGPGSPERDRYWFRPGQGDNGELPPNDWESVFGGPAWTQVKARPDAPGSAWESDTSWYLHMFDTSQPDLFWDNPEVRAEFESILRFWLDRGVDGFRVDVAHGLCKPLDLPNWQFHFEMVEGTTDNDAPPPPMWNQREVHEIYRSWRTVLDEYGEDKLLVAEVWADTPEKLAEYVRPDEMNQAFNFDFLASLWNRTDLQNVIDYSLRTLEHTGAPATWVMSNHDVVRATSRLGLDIPGARPNGIGATDPQPNAMLGRLRARAAHTLINALPGSTYIYQGEELGLPEHTSLPDAARQDPTFPRTAGKELGRDGCRIPLPWESTKPNFGFTTAESTWLPQPTDWEAFCVDVQANDPDSDLNYFKKLFSLRKEFELGRGSLQKFDAGSGSLAFINSARVHERPDVLIVVTFNEPCAVPEGWELLLSSQDCGDSDTVPADTAALFVRR
ncbi:glycoside hydrolase family 13 protein [Corynebacterium hindlerae]|uniref:glycoside hydrolase family 13 protein n=1 Tax=Corynebacterium hindlerae TaxID=699041 RepID=UPI001AD6DDF3|nr:glycoside hydrolase family 13 protein [Corynebacterium hindlerae]QTH60224.1 glycoside hydrolase family 13 protein [Corynebacterium hindlerae]